MVNVVYWRVVQCPVSPVDTPHEFVYLLPKFLILGYARTRWDTDLDECYSAPPLGVPREEKFEAEELVWHAFDII